MNESVVVTICMYNRMFLVFQIVFPRPGALGLNLRSFLVQEPAGARHGLPPYGTLKILDTQYIYLKVSELVGSHRFDLNGARHGVNASGIKCYDLCVDFFVVQSDVLGNDETLAV